MVEAIRLPLLRVLGPLCTAMALGFLSVSIPLAVLAVYVHAALGFSPAAAGLAVGLQSFATIATRAAAGRLVDARGAKPALLLGLLVCSGSAVLTLGAATLAGSPVVALGGILAGRLALGIGESLFITGVLSWALIRAGAGRAGLAMAWNGMAQYTALAAGAPIGFALYRAGGLAAVAAASLVLPLVAVLVVLPLAAPLPTGGNRLPLRTVVGTIALPGAALMLSGIGFASISTFASLDFLAHGWTGAEGALLAFGVCFVAVRLVGGGLPDRRGGRLVAVGAMAVEAVGLLLLWLAPGPTVALLGAGVTGAGCSLVFPALGLIALGRVPAAARGIAVGAFAAFQDLAIGLTGPVLGVVASLAGYPALYLVAACAAAAGASLGLVLRPGAPAPRLTAGPRHDTSGA